MTTKNILEHLPYDEPFLFVDGIEQISENGITGFYTFKDNAFFYNGHFKNNPVTPGVILTECMAQIGLVCLGIYLLKDKIDSKQNPEIALTSHNVDFFVPVFPNEKVTVVSEKEVFRFNKLKCNVKLFNSREELVARGKISGMIKT
ncbi:3-hydroxyacyl-ACP dehydratase FabZ family protein [uncultured Winogradskyella sp.]|uniref:3-hydroxyacyl-ACP dehydratase FabZ family protein n=1 Tax=uncultured Winogradskyella sp. TaxID=395353 RepID=UPI0035192B52